MPFQFGLTSGLVGGVGRDAGFVAARIHEQALHFEALRAHAA